MPHEKVSADHLGDGENDVQSRGVRKGRKQERFGGGRPLNLQTSSLFLNSGHIGFAGNPMLAVGGKRSTSHLRCLVG